VTITVAPDAAAVRILLEAAQAQFPAANLVRSLELQPGQISVQVGLPVGVVEVRLALETDPGWRLAVRLLSAHHRVGPFTVGYPLGLLRAVPQVRVLEARRWVPPAGWKFTRAGIAAGVVVLEMEGGNWMAAAELGAGWKATCEGAVRGALDALKPDDPLNLSNLEVVCSVALLPGDDRLRQCFLNSPPEAV
jgi:hypothetical protein